MRPSTEHRRWSGDAWPLDRIPDADLAAFLEIPPARAKAKRTELLRAWATSTALEAELEQLPAATLAMLMLLVEAGGSLPAYELDIVAKARFGLASDEVKIAVLAALRRGLTVPISSQYSSTSIALVAPAAERLGPLVLGLDLPELVGGFVPEDEDGPRRLLAVTAMLAHVDVKANQDGLPNRASVKKLAGQLGLEPEGLDLLVLTAGELGLIDQVGAVLRPRAGALARAAGGAVDHAGPLARAALQLVTAGPVAIEVVRRAVAAHDGYGPDPADELRRIPGLRVGRVGEVPAVTAAEVGGAPAGHVTPSFEVFVPPESPLRDVVQVARFAEVTRVDRVITLRVTRNAVSRAVAAGVTADEMHATLAALGRHAVPQNVEAAIRDWAAQSQVATVELGRVVVVAADADARAAAALAPLHARRVAPGVFVASPELRPSAIEQALRKAGIQVREPAIPEEPPPPRRAAPLPVLPAPPARLRARFAAWQRKQPTAHAADDAHRPDVELNAALGDGEATLDRWAARVGHRWTPGDPRRDGLALMLSAAGPEAAANLLAAPSLEQLIRMLVATVAILPDAALPMPRAVVLRLLGAPRPPVPAPRPPVPAPRSAKSLALDLAACADHGEPVTLTLHAGRVTRVHVIEIVKRGSATMVLVEDADTHVGVAYHLGEIAAIAASPETDPIDGLPPGRWVPAAGDRPPPGHLPCPCGSGDRYRTCCRTE